MTFGTRSSPALAFAHQQPGDETFVLDGSLSPVSKNPTRRALGAYGALTLEQAREKARRWLELIRKGIDPAVAEEERRQAALRQQANTFASVAEDYLRLQVDWF